MKKILNKFNLFSKSHVSIPTRWKDSLLKLYLSKSGPTLLLKPSMTNKYLHTKLLYSTLLGVITYKYFLNNKAQCIEDDIIKRARSQVDSGLLQMKQEFGTQMMTFPEVNFDFKGGRYSMEFLIDQRKCDLFSVLVSFLQAYEADKAENGVVVKSFTALKDGNIMTIQLDFEEYVGNPKKRLISKGTVYLTGENILDRPNFKFRLDKTEDISVADLRGFLQSYKEANKPSTFVAGKKQMSTMGNIPNQLSNSPQSNAQKIRMDAFEKLEKLGVVVFLPDSKNAQLDWDYLAGYEKQKRDIEDTVLLALTFPQIYDDITKGTRMKVEPNKPKAVLFEGPPGTGKTTSAKIIAQQVAIPLIYMPIESIMSKYYGESEKRFAEIFDSCKHLGKSIIFIDEIDAIAGSRDNTEMHEASRRILSTLLRKIDSFESTTDVLLICATNRKQDLDQAMLSRIDLSVKFELPDKHSRAAIFQRYAKHLPKQELDLLAEKSSNMSGRNISDVCKDAERRFAAKLIRKEAHGKLPILQDYVQSLESRISQNLA